MRLALNPILSTAGYILPQTISGATITAVVLSLPTTGSLLLKALISQDMYLAGSFILLLAALTVIGTFVSDLLLAWVGSTQSGSAADDVARSRYRHDRRPGGPTTTMLLRSGPSWGASSGATSLPESACWR